MTVKHKFVSAIADGADATVVRPSNWNDDHSILTTTVEVNLGAPSFAGRFSIVDALIAATSKLLVWQAPGPYTGKGTANSADEGTMDPITITAVVPAAGSCMVYWQTIPIYATVPYKSQGGDLGGIDPTPGDLIARVNAGIIARRGLVHGNVKFTYFIFG